MILIKFINSCAIYPSRFLDKYIEQVCLRYNLEESTLKRLLGTNYNIDKIEEVASELASNINKMNSLPFANIVPDKRIVFENVGLIENHEYSSSKECSEEIERFSFMLESKNK